MSNSPSCLVLHGYGGAPFDVSFLVQALRAQGRVVRVPCLPGHGESRETFARSRFSQWLDAAERSLVELLDHGPCMVIGLSMGGSLALALAQRYELAGVVTIAAPVFLYTLLPWQGASKLLPFVSLLRFVLPIVHVPRHPDRVKCIAPYGGYEGFQALHPLHSFLKGLRPIGRNLHRVHAPLLILHSPQDQIVPVANAWRILLGVSSPVRRLELLPIVEHETSRHLLTTHVETRDRVQKAVIRFGDSQEVQCAG